VGDRGGNMSRRFIARFGKTLVYGLPYWATLVVWHMSKGKR